MEDIDNAYIPVAIIVEDKDLDNINDNYCHIRCNKNYIIMIGFTVLNIFLIIIIAYMILVTLLA